MTERLDKDGIGPTAERRAFRYQLMQHMAKKEISAAELARRADLSKDAISSYMAMRSLPTKPTLAKLAKVLGCKPEALRAVGEGEDAADTVIEIREYNQPGYKLLVARVPIPGDVVAEVFTKLMQFAADNKARKKK